MRCRDCSRWRRQAARRHGAAHRSAASSSRAGNRTRVGSSTATVPGLRHRGNAFVAEMFEMIGGQRIVFRRQDRAARIGQLLGMQLHAQPMRFRRREDALGFVRRKGDGLAERIDGIGQLLARDRPESSLRRSDRHRPHDRPCIPAASVCAPRKVGETLTFARSPILRRSAQHLAARCRQSSP